MLISQISDADGMSLVVVREADAARSVKGAKSVYALALEAARAGRSLADVVAERGLGETVDLEAAYREGRVMAPIRPPRSGASASYRHRAHPSRLGRDARCDAQDSQRRGEAHRLDEDVPHGAGGRQAAGPDPGVQPEWFYKGNGNMVVEPGKPLVSPAFALDAGEEPEIAGIYLIGDDGTPFRLGFALSNEFSDHVTERINYLYLAHSKLRNASLGPEILVGPLPEDIRGTSRILRGGRTLWEKPFLSGEANMSHTIANLEHHHFKYEAFRQPGDVHVHMFGTATLSFADGIKTEAGDVFEIEAPGFGLPLRNPLTLEEPVTVEVREL